MNWMSLIPQSLQFSEKHADLGQIHYLTYDSQPPIQSDHSFWELEKVDQPMEHMMEL